MEVISRVKDALLTVIKDQNSSPHQVRNAFAYLYKDADRSFITVVNLLCENHPAIAEEFLDILPERFIPKDFACAVDGYTS